MNETNLTSDVEQCWGATDKQVFEACPCQPPCRQARTNKFVRGTPPYVIKHYIHDIKFV